MLFCQREALESDEGSNASVVLRFVKDQIAAGVVLLRADEVVASRAASTFDLHSEEFGVFGGRYILFFRRPNSVEFAASVMLVPVSKLLSLHLSNFWQKCIRNSEKVSVIDDKLVFQPLGDLAGLIRRFEETLIIK